jgi:hypothetical protein
MRVDSSPTAVISGKRMQQSGQCEEHRKSVGTKIDYIKADKTSDTSSSRFPRDCGINAGL